MPYGFVLYSFDACKTSKIFIHFLCHFLCQLKCSLALPLDATGAGDSGFVEGSGSSFVGLGLACEVVVSSSFEAVLPDPPGA